MFTRLILLILLCLCGCSQHASWIESVPTLQNIGYSDVQWLDIPDSLLKNPTQMIVSGSEVIIASEASVDALVVYDIVSKSIMSGVKVGRAANEVLSINQLFEVDGKYVLVDVVGQKTLFVDKATLLVIEAIQTEDYSALVLHDDKFLGSLTTGQARYGIRSLNDSDYIATFGDYSEFGIDMSIGWRTFQGHLLLSGDRLASFGYYYPAYQIVDCSKLQMISSINLDDTYISTINGDGSLSMESTVNFISLTGNDDCIYVLYDGHSLDYYVQQYGQKPGGNTIVKLNWNGEIVGKYEFPRPIYHISYNKTDDSLYLCLLNDAGEYVIGRLKL